RQLRRCDDLVELTSRYLDALILLLREQGKLGSKERFLDEVWGGIPVTEEALTQGIRTLRKQLGDSVANPRFIETVPKHGYRFIAPVGAAEAARALPEMPHVGAAQAARALPTPPTWTYRDALLLTAAG